ncbi:hypothetical protein HYALB_00009593 [Hymenoscyphus albidus]|uniref:Apple domain-containing protein n=1 Tax=Hymenoscyphus albidus TaxID=595503 RepID=A0A9N9M6H4_9HELO|nr:hypothetical protein HYALB_00009593 [Hymenoscyphus albidus]
MILPINFILAVVAILPCATSSPLLPKENSVIRPVHAIEQRATHIIATPSVTSSPTSTTKKHATKTTTTPIVTKTGVADCNVQGTANEVMTSKIFGSARASDILNCQVQCRTITACISYSYQPPASTKDDNCVFYNMFLDKGVKPSKRSGIFFSDKYPDDGSDYCYSSG